MTTVGFGSGSFSNNIPRKDRGRKRKQLSVRQSLLESLEARHLMAAGPQLIGVQPNEGSLIALGSTGANATVLNVSPREITLRFDDTSAIDASTFSGIQIKRAGADAILESAYVSTDLGTNGQVVLDFSASLPGQQGNGLELRFTQSARTSSITGKPASWPILSVAGSRINIDLNTLAGNKTTASDLIQAMNADSQVSAKVLVKRLRGVESTIIADTVTSGRIFTLQGADSARVSSNLNSGSNTLQVEFISTRPGTSGANSKVEFISRDFGGQLPPIVTVTGQTVRVEVNSNSRFLTTVQEVVDAINNSSEASLVLQARLISGSTSARVGGNFTSLTTLTLVSGDDVAITPAYIGFGDNDREIVVRFAETLPDDFYLIDILGSGPFALRNTSGLPFNGGVNKSVRFDLDLGTTIQAVVPQPVIRSASGVLTQLRNQIYVYFNDDDLNTVEAVKPDFYQLVYTGNTLSGLDDISIKPSSVSYDASLNRVALTFNRNIDAFVNPSTNELLPIAAMRLRIGNSESPTGSQATVINPVADPGSRFASATDLGSAWLAGAGAKAAIVNSDIRNTTSYPLDYPGANDEQGNRDNRYQHHVTRVDTDGIAVISYNFSAQLGTANQSVQLNTITDAQKVMVRQVMSLYERYLGVRFTESDNLGFTIAVGDMQAINSLTSLTTVEANSPGGLTYAAGPLLSNPTQSAVIIDGQDFNTADDNLFGTELFRSFMRGIGVLLGLGSADEMPQATVQNNSPITDPNVEQVFPGNADILHGQFVLRPEGKDIDLYKFSIPAQGGRLQLQVAAERQSDSSLLDASLRLYRNDGTATKPVWTEIAANEDYFSADPRINLDFVRGGDYVIGVSAKGNTSYDPNVEDSGLGGKSEGKYQLRIDYKPPAASSLVDVNGAPTAIDGDGNGRPGGVFNYWFVPTRPDRAIVVPGTPDTSAYTVWVDKVAAAGGNGTLARPYNTIAAALLDAGNVTRADATGTRAVTVRILGNTASRAYEVGFNRFGIALADGATFDAPKNVTVMIDAGAIIKMGRARISAGSSTVSVDRSGGTLQLLGIPDTRVIVTSINDTVGIGVNPDRTPPAPAPGDWGGIDFRNRIDGSDETRVDKERNGLFLNAVVHSDIRYGGGQVVVDGVSQIITPINLIDSRPAVYNNLITRSADAALSATPNSFKEDDFLDPRSQANGFFIPDYDRVGPDIHGNKVINNTLNGLFVKTKTGVADTLETLTVSARFDDIDIPYVIGENLVVAGTPGGGVIDTASPPTTVVTLNPLAVGSLAAGTYNYRLVYVDAAGNESLASIPTSSLTVAANSSISLANLPPIGGGLPYVARRLYRSDSTGAGTYRFVSQLNAVANTFVDNGSVTGGALVPLNIKVRSRLNGGLVIDAGSILKFRGSRIELRDGGSLIAEGTSSLPIVMTSLNDNRYGFGGTFDTANTRGTRSPVAGDWGGIFVGQGSAASLDYDRLSYAGGTTRIEGGFASFNAIEVHQADFRMSNSRLESSASGIETSSSSRVGRGTNTAAGIFVRGSQPILVNNRIIDNAGPAISIDVNSLNSDLINDHGRVTGEIGLTEDFVENQGPLITGNRLSRNSINGLFVRGQTLTTQSVWDDTDIVHVLQNEVISSNTYTLGGVKLLSKNSQSLVVKLLGDSAGFTATGVPLDINDRIGGSVSLVGTPSAPVILTSISDCSVGAGFTLDGQAQIDTINSCSSQSTIGADVVVIMDESASMFFAQQFSVQLIADLEAGFQSAGIGKSAGNRYGLVGYANANDIPRTIPVGANGELFGTSTEYGIASNANLVVDGAIEDGWAAIDFTLKNYTFRQNAAKYAILVTNEDRDEISTQSKQDLIDRLNAQGVILNGIYEAAVEDATGAQPFLALDNQTRVYKADGSGGFNTELGGRVAVPSPYPFSQGTTEPDYIDITFATNGIFGDIEQIQVGGTTTQSFSNTLVTTFIGQAGAGIGQPGDWKGVEAQTYSNDRNVASTTERESARASAPSSNETPSTSQYLGQLAKLATSGDENARLGFEIQATLNKPSDVDVYSFTANGGTEVWFDIDRTTLGLDSVVELISADGTILALSDDSYLEETQSSTHPLYSALSGNSVNPLRKGSLIQVPRTSLGEARDDYGTNPKDAGMRVLLPGQANQATLYHVRVRSSNQNPGQAAGTPALSNPSSVGKGLSRGSYQLQIRLGETQEFPGTSVSYADIRYAANGITLSGVPRHSPLVGETAEVQITNNDVFANAQELGNIVQSDRQTISVAGTLSSGTDVDWFAFSINYQSLISPLAKYLSTVFDVDYADGIGRADMSMYLFDSTGRLVQFGENSNILDDRATAARGADNTDLGRGSAGSLDPFIGSVELPAGRYFLALTNRTQVPSVIANRLNRTGTQNDSGVRIQPINSGRFIVEDRVGNDRLGAAAQAPITPTFLPQSSRVEYTLGDLPMYVTRDRGLQNEVYIANSFTGVASNFVGTNSEDIRDIAMRPNGDIRAFRSLEQGGGDANAAYINVDSGTGATTVVGNLGIITNRLVTSSANPPTIDLAVENAGLDVEALTFTEFQGGETGFLIANRKGGIGTQYTNNVLYRFDPNTGRGISAPALDNAFNIITGGTPNPPDIILGAGTNITERGFIQTASPAGTTSTTLAVTEATQVRSSTRSLVRDGDSVTIRVLPNTIVNFEFNSGPELLLNFDPTAIPSRQLNNGDRFVIDGINYQIETGSVSTVPPGFRTVFYSASMTNEQFVESLRQAVPSTIQIGFDGTRVNFGRATTGSFGTLVARGVAFDVGSTGNVASGRIPVDFYAEDTAETIAVRLAQVITGAGFAGLSAATNGNLVQLVGADFLSATGSSTAVGVAPGGNVTGIAGIGSALFAVSDQGGLYRVSAAALAGNTPGAIGSYVAGSYQLRGIQFNALTAGPRNLEGGRYANLLFGTDVNGRTYAFNTNGELQNVFSNGQSSVATGISGANGIAFSNLDFNLWHQTTRRGTDAGHGINTPNDLSDTSNTGDTSWYFGFEDPSNQITGNLHSNASFDTTTNPLTFPRAGNQPVQNTYNFPGGALGVLESKSFSLAGMTAQDLPTLYFNYFLATDDGASSLTTLATDSFRVYGSDDAGVWHVLTTNNRDPLEVTTEKTTNNAINSTSAPGQAWRQARVDLGVLAGSKDVRLRFEFNTAGSMGFGTQRGGGLEMRVVSGAELRDGQTFTVGGRQFEIEMGYTLVVPSGTNVSNGDTFNVLGLDFVFWNGIGTSPSGNVIRFNASDAPDVLAQSIFAVISNAAYPKASQSANLADPAGGSDVLSRALSIGVTGGAVRVTAIGAIGDNPNLVSAADRDIDLFRLNLDAGTQIVLTASSTTVPGSQLDPYLRLFDESGTEIAANNDFGGVRDSRISFTIPKTGRYFAGVSGSANSRYNPNVVNSGSNGGSQGQYELSVDVTPRLNFSVVGNRIQVDGASSITLPANSPLTLEGKSGLNDATNVPVYILQNMSASQVAQRVAQVFEATLAGGADAYATYKQRGSYIDLTGLTVGAAGPFTVSTPRVEDSFSEFGTGGLPLANKALNNAFEGVYLDDFIIGLAERGETVTGARVDTSFVSVPSAGSGILVGPYQLEIRGGQEYGQPLLPNSPNVSQANRVPEIQLVSSFAPNQQQSRSQTIKFNGSFQIADGQTIFLNDGINSVTLEFDDLSLLPNSPARGVQPGNLVVPYNSALNESGNVIASRIRDIINGRTVQSLLTISAISSDGSLTGQNTNEISLVGTITVKLPSSVGVAQSLLLDGDRNTQREQGQVVIENSQVSNSAGFGITLQADPRDAVSNAPNPGSVRNTITLNNQRLIPGAVVVNNELTANVAGGINIVGDTATGNVPAASVPFARIVNNTILGGTVTTPAAPPAATFGDDFYGAGSISFADSVRSYNSRAGGGPVPLVGLQTPNEALNAPNYSGIGEPIAGQGVVSLGRGGVLVVQFTNNILTGSDDPRPDLAVYEVGNAEQVRVEVSPDNVNYTSVGTASFLNRYIDLDAFGFNSLSQLFYVRLTDVANDGSISGDSVGADIDAVGAISSRPAQLFAPGGTGIRVGANASPTIINNIVVNNTTGIFVDPTSTSTVLGATLYQGNSANSAGSGSLGQFPITVATGVPLFTNPGNRNLYPVPNSPAIDSTIDTLVDRSALLSVKQPLGLAASPIIAPTTDINGLLRVDDPSVETPPGLGEGIFKDRGAADRADFVGPSAVALNPFDNDALGSDSNPAVGIVELTNKTLSYFDIQLVDSSQVGNKSQGTGIDPLTVTRNSVLLYQNGQILVESLDYRFGYNPTNNIVRLTPLAGIWDSESVYQVRFINTNESAIDLVTPKSIVDGTKYTILDSTNTNTTFELETGIRLRVPSSTDGFTTTAVDGTIFRVDDGFQQVTFEFDSNATTQTGTIPILFDSQDQPALLAEKVATAIQSAGLQLSVKAIGGSDLQILGSRLIKVLPVDSKIVVSGQTGTTPAYGFQIPTSSGLPVGFADGQRFSIQRGNTTFVFEFDDNGTVATNNIPVPLSGTTDGLAASIVSAINKANLSLTASFSSGGLISVGAQSDLRLQATNTVLQVVGVAGRPATIPVVIDLTQVLTSSQAAELLFNKIAASNLPGVQLTQLASTILIEGARGVAGLGAFPVNGVRDLAGNAMKATENDGKTLLTIFLGEGLDYGDAADPIYATKRASNGPTHIVVAGFSLGPTATADADARVIDLDTDDGVTVLPLTAAFGGSIVVNVQGVTTSRPAFINAWLDANGNGIFESTEKVPVSGRIGNGDNSIAIPRTIIPGSSVTSAPVVLRVRMSSQEVLGPTGAASDGEVEDYYVNINSNPYNNPSNRLDVNGDGGVSPLDVLQLVNYINANGSGLLPFPAQNTPPYLDVNGNGFADPLDVITVINYINAQTPGGGVGGEGESSVSDRWVSASSYAAPAVMTKSSSDTRAPAQVEASKAIRSLDSYLASVSSDIGPALAVDQLDWSSILPAEDSTAEEKDSGLALNVAIDDILGSLI
ncbi:MAG: pre-peptidase C-terminal domain-containing protein [Planctomycetota bacterium]|nr:pre-peptidase C-terminal domain-containing protein [Planctomycetota bacterium]